MTVTQALQNAQRGLAARNQEIAIASNNVTNANTPGATKKRVTLSPDQIGNTGLGVRVASIERQVNEKTLSQLREYTTDYGSIKDLKAAFNDIQSFLGNPRSNNNFAGQLSSFTRTVEFFKTEPSFESRLKLVEDGKNFAASVNGIADYVQSLRENADAEIGQLVTKINNLLGELHELNKEIGLKHKDPFNVDNISDQRDQKINELSELLDIQVLDNGDGTISIQTKSGKTLLGQQANTLFHDPSTSIAFDDQFDPANALGGGIEGIFINSKSNENDITDEIRGGRLKGLIDLRDTHLPNMAADIEKLSYMVKTKFNEAHNAGTSSTLNKELVGNRRFLDTTTANINLSSTARIALINTDGSYADFVDIPAGNYSVNDIIAQINSIDPSISASIGAPDNRLQINHPSLGIAITDLSPQTVTYDGDTFNGFSHFFGLNDFFVDSTAAITGATISSTIKVRDDITQNGLLISNGELNKDPAPVLGTTRALPFKGDSEIISKLAEALTESHQFDDGFTFKPRTDAPTPVVRTLNGDLPSLTTSISNFTTNILARNSASTQNFEQLAISKQALVTNAENKFQSESGINIDEEMSEMILIQQNYSASARVITVTTELFDILANIV